MALLALALLAIIIISFIGAAFSSRARSEKKSIASFHQHMDQLSGVVKSESHLDEAGSETGGDPFASIRSHVKVVGKANSTKSAASARRRSYRSGSAGVSGGKRGRPARVQHSPVSQPPNARQANSNAPHFQAEANVPLAGIEAENEVSSGRRRSSTTGRRNRLSSSVRSNGEKLHTQIRHFDDSMSEGLESEADNGLTGAHRKVNTKVLAAASVVALVGLGTIYIALSGSHSPAAAGKLPPSASTKPTTPTKSPVTTVAPVPPSGPLTPTSSDSIGATYFVDSPSITVNLVASAPSWVEEAAAPGSRVLWQGIIPAGGNKSFTLNSSMWIRTGNVGVLTITANGQPVSFSANPGVYDFTFRQGVKA